MREQDTEPFTSALAMTDALSFTLRSASYRASVQREPRCPANAAKDHTNAGAADRVIVERSMLTKDAADALLAMRAEAVRQAHGKLAVLLVSNDAFFRQVESELKTAGCSCFLVSERSFEQVHVVVEGCCHSVTDNSFRGLRCDLCGVSCPSKEHLLAHAIGKKHQKAKARLAAAAEATAKKKPAKKKKKKKKGASEDP